MKEIIKKQFESLVKGHFLQQVKPVVPELDIAGTSDKDEVTAAEKKSVLAPSVMGGYFITLNICDRWR